jgi:DNA helicase TIP49 (TBP-interacting protein)
VATSKTKEFSGKESSMHFKTMAQIDVPQGRRGKHKEIVTTILKDLDRLAAGSAIKVPLSELAEGKAKVRSALNRATRKNGHVIATASDGEFLYIWNAPSKS